MSDLNTMIREQAVNGLRAQLDAAVTNGDTEAARKITDDIAKLAVSAAPKAPAYGDAEIKAQLEKAPWFGTDPKKSAKAIEFGKTMNPSKFPSAEAFAEALVKAVDAEFAPAGTSEPKTDGGDDVDDEGDDTDTDDETDKPEPKKQRRATDAPGESEAVGGRARRATGPWAKLSDAPPDVQKEIKRTADKFVSSSAPKEHREKFIQNALAAQYAVFQRNKGKK